MNKKEWKRPPSHRLARHVTVYQPLTVFNFIVSLCPQITYWHLLLSQFVSATVNPVNHKHRTLILDHKVVHRLHSCSEVRISVVRCRLLLRQSTCKSLRLLLQVGITSQLDETLSDFPRLDETCDLFDMRRVLPSPSLVQRLHKLVFVLILGLGLVRTL